MHKVQENRPRRKICRLKPGSGINQNKTDKARVATVKTPGEDEDKPVVHEARALRSELGTPKLLL